MSSLRNWVGGGLKRYPWVGAIVGLTVSVVLAYFGMQHRQRAQALGDAPRRLTVAAALAEARERPVWAELSDARFDCEGSSVLGKTRVALLRAAALEQALAVSADGAECPSEDRPLSGAFIELGSRRRSLLVEAGLSGAATADVLEFSLREGPNQARAASWVLFGLAAASALAGGIGFMARRDERQLVRKAAGDMPYRELRARLLHGERRIHPRWAFARVAELLLLVPLLSVILLSSATASLIVASDAISYRSRWAAAEPVQLDRPATISSYGVTNWSGRLLTTLVVQFQANGTAEEVDYLVAWVPRSLPTPTVRSTGGEYVTDVETALLAPRLALAAAMLTLAAGLAVLLVRHLRAMQRTYTVLRAALTAPQLVDLPLIALGEIRQNGFLTGWKCQYRDVGGEERTASFSRDRRPAVDNSGTRVLAVSPSEEGGAAILVAADGYPFELPR